MPELRDNLPFTPADYRDAGVDYLAARFGARQIDAHPTAERMADHGVTLAEMAFAFGARESLRRRINPRRVQAT